MHHSMTDFFKIVEMEIHRFFFVLLRGGLGNILHAQQRVSTVWAAQDTWGKHYGQ